VQSANSGLVVPGGAFAIVHRDLIVTLAARHKLPAIYWDRAPVADGGLISYGPDFIEQYRQATVAFSRARRRTCRRHCSPAPTR
jgi:hypothetical protein